MRPRCIIVDGVSHEWWGKGGMLAMVDDAGGGFRAWKEPRNDHTDFMNVVTTVPCHFIFCIRLKEKHDQIKIGGKYEIVNLGWRTDCDSGIPYDMTVNLSLKRGGIIRDPERPGIDFENEEIWTIPDFFEDVIKPGVQIDERLGAALADWCAPPKENWPDGPDGIVPEDVEGGNGETETAEERPDTST